MCSKVFVRPARHKFYSLHTGAIERKVNYSIVSHTVGGRGRGRGVTEGDSEERKRRATVVLHCRWEDS